MNSSKNNNNNYSTGGPHMNIFQDWLCDHSGRTGNIFTQSRGPSLHRSRTYILEHPIRRYQIRRLPLAGARQLWGALAADNKLRHRKRRRGRRWSVANGVPSLVADELFRRQRRGDFQDTALQRATLTHRSNPRCMPCCL